MSRPNESAPSTSPEGISERFARDADLFGVNSSYIESLYEAYLNNPASVPAAWAERFTSLPHGPAGTMHQAVAGRMRRAAPMQFALASEEMGIRQPPRDLGNIEYPSRSLYLIHAYRVHGHLHANLDPLRLEPRQPSPELELGYYGLSEADLDTPFPTWDMLGPPRLPLREILAILQRTYCGCIGPEFMHITDSAKKRWIQERLESIQSTPRYDADTRRHIFSRVMKAQEFERFLHTRYVGQKRFSLEGGESLIPLLDALVQKAGDRGAREIILGMAHRGRLNVLANILGKSLNDVFAEFEGLQFEDDEQESGDVKYHLGYSSEIRTPGGIVHLSLAFNPSHLEIITPVVLGSVRARQCRRQDSNRGEAIALLVHGDAAFAGQGVVAESLNLSKLGGFRTGGAIHVVVNNQIGFTTNPFDARSTLYCTDIAKMVQAPIFHVNGDDPEAVTLVANIAMEYRYRFRQDVVIDMICYRRHGHNETDTPAVTQPVMYRKIAAHPSVQQLYRDRLVRDGVLSLEEAEGMVAGYREGLEDIRRAKTRSVHRIDSLQGRWAGFQRGDAPEPDTTVDAETLLQLARRVHSLPANFQLHEKVERIFDARVQMMEGKRPVDWGCAEIMAYATLISSGGWVRISGQDTGRGAFFHRHAVVYDQLTGKSHVPLKQAASGDLARIIVVDSMLSEEAVLAFEYGYTVAEPRALVIWEAQYGDFANNAQVVIDQFVSSSETKWGRMSGLVLWLPHGYEGQGPEHSSARLERYLQLCAQNNMQVVYPTTPAQLFHLLRRQYLINMRKPLIMMAPKSMLRQKLSFSALEGFTSGSFQPLLPEQDADMDAAGVRRVLLCSGKIYYELLAERRKRGIEDIAIIRIERLYPFPLALLRTEIARYAAASEVVWVQEEPRNQGAWYQIKHHLPECILDGQALCHVARDFSAAPAVGSLRRHIEQQQAILDQALTGTVPCEKTRSV